MNPHPTAKPNFFWRTLPWAFLVLIALCLKTDPTEKHFSAARVALVAETTRGCSVKLFDA